MNREGKTMSQTKDRALQVLDADEIEALFDVCSTRAVSGIRDAAIIECMVGGGLRNAEVCALTFRNYSSKNNTISIHQGKGGKNRTVKLLKGYRDKMDKWLIRREALGLPKSGPLFCLISKGRIGERMDTDSNRKMIKRRAARAALSTPDREVWPHLLRHSHAALLALKGAALPVVQNQLGHSRATITDAYLRGIGAGTHLEAIDNL